MFKSDEGNLCAKHTFTHTQHNTPVNKTSLYRAVHPVTLEDRRLALTAQRLRQGRPTTPLASRIARAQAASLPLGDMPLLTPTREQWSFAEAQPLQDLAGIDHLLALPRPAQLYASVVTKRLTHRDVLDVFWPFVLCACLLVAACLFALWLLGLAS